MTAKDKLCKIESYCNDLINLNKFSDTIESRIASKIIKIIKED